MTSCQGQILIGQAVKPVEVLFSNGAEVSYLNDTAASKLGFDLSDVSLNVDPVTTVIADISGREITCHQTISIKLRLGDFQHEHNVLIVPGTMPYLVLGMDWFRRFDISINFGEHTVTVRDGRAEHVIKTRSLNSGSVVVPSMSVISRTENQKKPKSKASSRNRLIKEGWGNRPNFQHSYGLKMTPEDIEEGNRILDMLENSP